MPHRLRNKNFAAVLEALIEYAEDGGEYSFVSSDESGKLLITITVEDESAYTEKHISVLEMKGFGQD